MNQGTRHNHESRQRIARSMSGRRNAMANRGGRPTRYRPEYARQVYRLCLLGLIDTQLADFYDVSVRTLNHWKKRYPDFWRGMCRGKLIADAEVAQALYRAACGYYHSDTHISAYKGVVTTVTTMKYYPPSVQACVFWLTNRQPNRWSNENRRISLGRGQVMIGRELTAGEIAAGERWISQLNEFANLLQRQRLLPVATE